MTKLSNLEFFKLVAANGDAGSDKSRIIYPSSIAKTLGLKLVEVGPATATIEILTDTERHANPMGTVHGGVFRTIAVVGFRAGTGVPTARNFATE